jgi:hypothetical protein
MNITWNQRLNHNIHESPSDNRTPIGINIYWRIYKEMYENYYVTEALLKDCAHAKVVESNRWTTTKAEHTLLDKTFAREAIEEEMQTILHRNSVTCRSKTKGYTARATDEPGIHYYSCSSPTRRLRVRRRPRTRR